MRCVALCCVVLRCVVLWFVVLCCWWPLEVRSIAVVLIGVCHGGGVGMWAGGFITWGGFWFVFLQSCVFHPVSQHLSACMFSLKIPCRRVWVQTLCCDFECLVFDRNKYLMMMMLLRQHLQVRAPMSRFRRGHGTLGKVHSGRTPCSSSRQRRVWRRLRQGATSPLTNRCRRPKAFDRGSVGVATVTTATSSDGHSEARASHGAGLGTAYTPASSGRSLRQPANPQTQIPRQILRRRSLD